MEESERSYARLERRHLARLAEIAEQADRDLCRKRPDLDGYLLGACLAQGAARHYLDNSTGIKDFDVWLFYSRTPDNRDAPARRTARYDFGSSPFGRHPSDGSRFKGRRVDLLCRTAPVEAGCAPREAIIAWLDRTSTSARFLRVKPIVLLYPTDLMGKVVWTGQQ